MIVGEWGMGKSWMMKGFVKDMCENEEEMLKEICIVGVNRGKLVG